MSLPYTTHRNTTTRSNHTQVLTLWRPYKTRQHNNYASAQTMVIKLLCCCETTHRQQTNYLWGFDNGWTQTIKNNKLCRRFLNTPDLFCGSGGHFLIPISTVTRSNLIRIHPWALKPSICLLSNWTFIKCGLNASWGSRAHYLIDSWLKTNQIWREFSLEL